MNIIHLKKISFVLLLLLVFVISSCEKQEEQMENRDAIVGKWDVVEREASAVPVSVEVRGVNDAYIVHITRSETFADEVYLFNFFNIGYDYYIPAAVDGKTITIDEITLRDYTIRGEGAISSNSHKIEWTYWVEGPYGDEKEYRATYSFIE